jgi:hypothetical protein
MLSLCVLGGVKSNQRKTPQERTVAGLLRECLSPVKRAADKGLSEEAMKLSANPGGLHLEELT